MSYTTPPRTPEWGFKPEGVTVSEGLDNPAVSLPADGYLIDRDIEEALKIANDPFGRSFDPHSREGLEAIIRAEEAAKKRRKAAEEAANVEEWRRTQEAIYAQEFEEKQNQLAAVNQQCAALLSIAKLHDPRIPGGFDALNKITAWIEANRPELSLRTVSEAANALFASGELTPDYSTGAHERALSEVNSYRQQGIPIPADFDKPLDQLSDAALRDMENLPTVSVKNLKELTAEVNNYAQARQKPAPTGTRLQRRMARLCGTH